MKATFNIKIGVDYPNLGDKNEMTKWVNTIVGDIAEHLGDDVTIVELLNHTLVITDG